jgi:hypothetical protein
MDHLLLMVILQEFSQLRRWNPHLDLERTQAPWENSFDPVSH